MARRHRAAAFGEKPRHCTRDFERNTHEAAIPARRGPRLPVAIALLRDALGRRKPAHQTRHADWFATRECTLHSRRAEHRPALARQREAYPLAQRTARPGQHRDCGGARQGDDARRRLYRGHRPACRPPRRRGGICRHTRRDAESLYPHLRLPERPPHHRNPRYAAQRHRHAAPHRGYGQQPERRDGRVSARHVHLRHGRIGQRQVDPHQRNAPAHSLAKVLPLAQRAHALRKHRGHRTDGQGGGRGPKSAGTHAALQSRHLHRRTLRHSQPVCQSARSENKGLQTGTFLFQRERRTLRDLQGQRLQEHRDELPARRARALRNLPRETL